METEKKNDVECMEDLIFWAGWHEGEERDYGGGGDD